MVLETAAPPEKPKLAFWAPSTFEIIIPPRYVRTVWHLEWCKNIKKFCTGHFFNLLIFRRFSTLRMWFLHVSPISSMLLIPRHLFESFRSSDSDLMNKGWFNELVGGHFTCTFLSVQHVTVQQARSAYITEDISHRDFMMWGKNGMSGMWLSDAQWAVGGWTFLAIVYDETCQALLWKFCAPCFQWKKYLETRVNL